MIEDPSTHDSLQAKPRMNMEREWIEEELRTTPPRSRLAVALIVVAGAIVILALSLGR